MSIAVRRPTALWAAFLLVATLLASVAGLAPFSPALPAWAHGGEVVVACDVDGTVGDLSEFRGIRFTVGTSFDSVELRMDGRAGGTYTFTAELRRSTGYTDPVVASVPVSADLPGDGGLGSVVHLDFPHISVSGPETETFTLRFVDISGPDDLFHETSGLTSDPCPNVEQTEENDVASPTVRDSDPTGFFVLRHNVLVVNDVGDARDGDPLDGVCATFEGVCTLRAAIE
ncbi:MAG: hypothetical protein Q8Q29_01680, partial [Actinomycetota bacterium]|nr:hypothetical protein [Actinomycetota bacterium]